MKRKLRFSKGDQARLNKFLEGWQTIQNSKDFVLKPESIRALCFGRICVDIHQNGQIVIACFDCEYWQRGKASAEKESCKHIPERILFLLDRKRVPKNRKNVDGFSYYQQPNKQGKLYWYMSFTVRGKTKPVYLGIEEPLFNPKLDLKKKSAGTKQREKKRARLSNLAKSLET